MLKAAAGGGGRGMRLVDGEDKLEAALAGARREAKAAFGDDTVYLEKAIVRPRHIEIQVFGDAHGNAVHLFERDCSIQRRNQKVIEESPSPAIDDETARAGWARSRCARRGRSATSAPARSSSCSTAPSRSFYFLEMNTRLQVEHPVTELVTGRRSGALAAGRRAGRAAAAHAGGRSRGAAPPSSAASTPRIR